MVGPAPNSHPSRIPALVAVAGSLLSSSLATSTKTVYKRTWDRFQQFAQSLYQSCFPASVSLLCLYIAHMVSSKPIPKPASLATALSAISYYHKIAGFPDPTSDFLIRKLLQGVSKSNPSLDNRLPITIPILHALLAACPHIAAHPYESALLASMFSVMFHAFLRVGEVTTSPHNIQFSQVTINSHINLQFLSFKHHKGPPFSLSIPPAHSSQYCPVTLLSTYIAVRGGTPGPLFCYLDNTPVSTPRFRALLRSALMFNNLQTLAITPHSFRIGAATYAASQGFSSTQIQAMGRWHSSAADRYVRISSFSTPST